MINTSYEVIKSDLKYTGKIFNVYSDRLSMPDGSEAVREYVLRGGAAAIVAEDPEGKILFVRQYRHPIRKMTLELPAGTLESCEEPELCALRELEEETGWKAKSLRHLTAIYTSVGICSELLNIYLAEGLEPGVQCLDADEFIELARYSLEDALEMICSGELTDAKTVTGLLMYKEYLSRRG